MNEPVPMPEWPSQQWVSLELLQQQLVLWQGHNFPGRDYNKPFKGMVEELGELSHALLKQEQGIRGKHEDHEEAIKDALADLVIFMADFCNARGYQLADLVSETWLQVRQRDWIKYPKTGRPE